MNKFWRNTIRYSKASSGPQVWLPSGAFHYMKALYTGDTDYGGERVLVKALPATWWENPARPQHLHGSAET